MNTEFPRHPLPGPDCAAMSRLLPLLHSPELDPDEAHRVRRHAESCPWCGPMLASYDTVDDALRRHFGGPSAPFLSMENIVNEYHSSDSSSAWVTEPLPDVPARQRRTPGRLSGLGALVAAALVIAFAGVILSRRAAGPGVGSGISPTATQQPATATGPTVYLGANGANGGLYALHGGDGSVAWRVAGPDIQATPVLVNGTVYALSTDHTLYAVRAPTHGDKGDILWHVQVRMHAASLVTDGKTLYIGTPKTDDVSSDAHGFIDAYDLSGKSRWTYGYATDDSTACVMSTLPGTMTAANGYVYASSGCPRGLVETIRASDGKQESAIVSPFPPGTRIGAGMGLTVADDVLYTNSFADGSGHLCAWKSHVERLWCKDFAVTQNLASTAPVVGNGVAAVVTDLDVVAVKSSDGSPLWTAHIGRLLGQPVLADGIIAVADGSRTLHALRASDGGERWNVTVQGNGSDPVMSGGVIYLHSYVDGTGTVVHALRATDGSALWKVTIPTTGSTNPAVG